MGPKTLQRARGSMVYDITQYIYMPHAPEYSWSYREQHIHHADYITSRFVFSPAACGEDRSLRLSGLSWWASIAILIARPAGALARAIRRRELCSRLWGGYP